MSDSRTYTNLQEYLEHCFKDTDTVTDAMLKEAKQKWRKIYLFRYQKQYRNRYIQISFRLSKKDYNRIEQLAQKENTSVTSYIKHIVLQDQKALNTVLNTIPLLEAIDLLEEAIHENISIDTHHLLSLLEKVNDC